jgi:hypothetical protein
VLDPLTEEPWQFGVWSHIHYALGHMERPLQFSLLRGQLQVALGNVDVIRLTRCCFAGVVLSWAGPRGTAPSPEAAAAAQRAL